MSYLDNRYITDEKIINLFIHLRPYIYYCYKLHDFLGVITIAMQ